MIPALILSAALQTSAAADFFPLKPGTVYIYEQTKGSAGQLTKVVGDTLDMGGVSVTPISDKQVGGGGATTYYRVDSDQVVIVAYDVKHPMPTPMPLLKLGTGKITWEFSGKTQTGAQGERLLARGEAHSVGQREILGKKVDVIEVRLIAQVGIGMSGLTFDQHAFYARGFGLVEWTSKTKLGNNKKSDESSFKLVDVQEAKSGG